VKKRVADKLPAMLPHYLELTLRDKRVNQMDNDCIIGLYQWGKYLDDIWDYDTGIPL